MTGFSKNSRKRLASSLHRSGPVHPLVIRNAEVSALRDAATILADAHRQADAERRLERQRGYEEGLQQSAEAGAAFLQKLQMETDAYWAKREEELVPLILAVAHKVLSDLPANDVMTGLVKTALAEHTHDSAIVVSVAPSASSVLTKALAGFDGASKLKVIADPLLSDGECVLVHPKGRTRIGLLDQFRALLAALKAP